MDSLNLLYETTDDPAAPDVALVDQSLHSFNLNAADLQAVRTLAVFARRPGRELVGGAVGRTWGACCELQQLWVQDELRRRGIGRELLQLFEAQARERGCRLIYLETFSFQCPEFYRAAGFEPAAEFRGFPDGIIKYIFHKRLEPNPRDSVG